MECDNREGAAALYLATLGRLSAYQMGGVLEIIARFFGHTDRKSCPWPTLRYTDTVRLRAWLSAEFKPKTARRYLTAFRCVLRAAFRGGLMEHADYVRATDVDPIKGSRLPTKGRCLEAAELRALFAVCATLKGHFGARNAAAVALLYGTGLRRSDLRGLDRGNVTDEALRVVGKGNLEREVHFPRGTRQAVRAWLDVRGEGPGPLLVPLTSAGDFLRPKLGRRMSEKAVTDLLESLARRAGLAHFSPQDLRRTFVGDLLDAGEDICTVQKLAGHASPTTTALYDRRGARQRARAAELLHVPFELARPSGPSDAQGAPGGRRRPDPTGAHRPGPV